VRPPWASITSWDPLFPGCGEVQKHSLPVLAAALLCLLLVVMFYAGAQWACWKK